MNNTFCSSDSLQNTNCFIYRSKEFPFNLQSASIISPKINRNQETMMKDIKIPLIEKDENKIKISENCINDFISILKIQNVDITNDNAAGLNYLAKEYEIEQLQKKTDKHILDHNELLLKVYSIKIFDDDENNDKYEEVISQRLIEFIDDVDLYDLPISSLHRIFSKSKEKKKK